MDEITEEPKSRNIWIELEKAKTFEEAKENCELATKLIHKMGVEKSAKFYAVKNQKYTDTFYNFTWSHMSGFTELDDRGTWFNLDYLANNEV